MLVLFPNVIRAQVCPGTSIQIASMDINVDSNLNDTMMLRGLVGPYMTTMLCATAQMGTQVFQCNPLNFMTLVRLRARFNVGFNTTMQVCTFICPGGTCQVRGQDGLPVELLDFTIDEDQNTGYSRDEDHETDTERQTE